MVTAATNTKVYDATTSAAATPTITSGTLVSGDTANFTESYDNKNVGTGKTLTPSGSVNDGNGGNKHQSVRCYNLCCSNTNHYIRHAGEWRYGKLHRIL